jgi:hypothetical protein
VHIFCLLLHFTDAVEGHGCNVILNPVSSRIVTDSVYLEDFQDLV